MSTARQLPDALPVLPGVALSGRYLVANKSSSSGDTLDALPLPGGRVGMFVVDVVGGGAPAEMAAGQARALLRERLGAGVDAAEAIASVDRYAHVSPELALATTCVAVLRLSDGLLEWATAGHPPPLHVGLSGSPTFLSTSGSWPLGSAPETNGDHRVMHTTRLEVGDMVGLFTDGLLTVGGGSMAQGQRDLAEAARRAVERTAPGIQDPGSRRSDAHHGDEVCDRILRRLVTEEGPNDDTALLVLTRTPRPEPFVAHVDATPEVLPALRHEINAWLDGIGAGLTDHVGLGHAVVELAANCVEHAYADRTPPSDCAISIDAELKDDGTVRIRVCDRGQWRRQGPAGRGLQMVAGLVDAMSMERSADGTCIELIHRLTRPVPLLLAVAESSDRAVVDDSRELRTEVGPGHLVVSGAIDALSEELFYAGLTAATCAGTMDAMVDLDGVTQLASPGVHALYEFARRARLTHSHLTLHARTGSPAAQILELVGLPLTQKGGEMP